MFFFYILWTKSHPAGHVWSFPDVCVCVLQDESASRCHTGLKVLARWSTYFDSLGNSLYFLFLINGNMFL
jgi:hypothetical protein